jgi:hypothetical protein
MTTQSRQSGYDPQARICWQFGNKGDRAWRCKCPAHSADCTWASFGRCRSGSRWFWVATERIDESTAEGWADSEEEAIEAAMAAVRSFCKGLPLKAYVRHGWASGRLKMLNEAKRRARPAPDTSDSRPVEYLYRPWGVQHQIVKKTKTRIFYNKREANTWRETELELGFVDRTEVELPEGQDYYYDKKGRKLRRYWFLQPPLMPQIEKPKSLRELKAAMADAHPDRGGTSEAFIKARRAYEAARKAQS